MEAVHICAAQFQCDFEKGPVSLKQYGAIITSIDLNSNRIQNNYLS